MSFRMSCFDEKISSQLHAAILLYGNNHGLNFASIHGVDIIKQQPRIKAGVPASKEAIRNLMESLRPETALPKMIFPQQVLASGSGYLAWYIEPCQRNLWFSCPELGGKVNGMVPLPGLVFILEESGGWHVFAYKGKGRPQPETVLFNSPFLNVWAGGRICEGNAGRPDKFGMEVIGEWEDRFFTSRFTHTNTEHRSITRYKGGAYQMWQDLLSGKWKTFPQSMLVSTNKTLQEHFKAIVGNRS